jgi:hypothetical protein
MRRAAGVVSLRIASLIAAASEEIEIHTKEWKLTLRATHQIARDQDLLLWVATEKSA